MSYFRFSELADVDLDSARDDLGKELRCFMVAPYLFFYRPIQDSKGIDIIRVLHSSKNITSDLFPDSFENLS